MMYMKCGNFLTNKVTKITYMSDIFLD